MQVITILFVWNDIIIFFISYYNIFEIYILIIYNDKFDE